MKKTRYIICIILLLSIIFSVTFPCFAEDTIYVWSNNSTPVNSNISEKNTTKTLELESASAILIEQSTGQILFEHNAHEQLRPASVTKIMSILLIMEALVEKLVLMILSLVVKMLHLWVALKFG